MDVGGIPAGAEALRPHRSIWDGVSRPGGVQPEQRGDWTAPEATPGPEHSGESVSGPVSQHLGGISVVEGNFPSRQMASSQHQRDS